MMRRISISQIPNAPRVCAYSKPCVYRVSGVCADPRCHKANSDSACHRVLNKTIISLLTEVASQTNL